MERFISPHWEASCNKNPCRAQGVSLRLFVELFSLVEAALCVPVPDWQPRPSFPLLLLKMGVWAAAASGLSSYQEFTLTMPKCMLYVWGYIKIQVVFWAEVQIPSLHASVWDPSDGASQLPHSVATSCGLCPVSEFNSPPAWLCCLRSVTGVLPPDNSWIHFLHGNLFLSLCSLKPDPSDLSMAKPTP